MPDVTIKKGDSSTTIGPYQCVDTNGSPVNLTGATSVTFVMRPITATAPTTNLNATVVNAAAGQVSYTPTVVDTAAAGMYAAEFHYTLVSGLKGTWPVQGYLEVLIEEDLVTATPVGRIVGLGEIKEHLNIVPNDRTKDAELLRFCDGSTPIIESLVGDVIQRQRQERYDGGWNYISLRHRPVVSVESVVEYRGPIAYQLQQIAHPDGGTIYSYSWEPTGRITRRTVGGGVTSFPAGNNSVEISYTSGYTAVPAHIRLGTLELIRVNYQQTQQGGRPTYGAGSGGADDYAGGSMMGFFVPNRVREILAPSRRHPSVA
jgi:hypothetical protein